MRWDGYLYERKGINVSISLLYLMESEGEFCEV